MQCRGGVLTANVVRNPAAFTVLLLSCSSASCSCGKPDLKVKATAGTASAAAGAAGAALPLQALLAELHIDTWSIFNTFAEHQSGMNTVSQPCSF